MARKKIITTTVTKEEPAPDAVELEPNPEPLTQDEVAEIDGVDYLLSLGGDDVVRYRVDKLPSKPGDREAFCLNYSRTDLSLDAIRESFGGGTYKITVYNARSQYMGQKRVTIAELPRSSHPAALAGPSADLAAVLVAAKGDNSGLMMIMEVFKQQSAMIAALLSKPAPVVPPPPSIMEMIAVMREMNRDQPKSSEESAVSMLLKGIELGKEFTGGGESMLGIAGKGLDMLRPLIERDATAPRGAAPAQRQALPASTAGAAAQPAPAAPTTENDAMLKQLSWLRDQTRALCHQAARGRSPDLYAEVLIDNLPDFITPADLLARVRDPASVQQLAQLNADVLKYQPWFEEFRKAVVGFLTDEPPAPAGGDEEPLDHDA